MTRTNPDSGSQTLTREQREERRRQVLNLMAGAAEDPTHQRAMFRAKVAGRLTGLLAQVGLSAANLARRTGVSAPQISKQLAGDANLTLDSLHKLASAAGAEVDITFRFSFVAAPTASVVTSPFSGNAPMTLRIESSAGTGMNRYDAYNLSLKQRPSATRDREALLASLPFRDEVGKAANDRDCLHALAA